MPEDDRSAAEEGNRLHKVYEECLIEGRHRLTEEEVPDEYVRNGLQVILSETLERFSTAEQVGTETRVRIKGAATFGTTDDWSREGRTLDVGDLKTGRVEVVARKNIQLMLYAVGLLDTLGWDNFDTVNLRIHGTQFKSTLWEVPMAGLRKWRDKVMMPAYVAINQINPEATPGEDQCQNCRARLFCKERAEHFKKSVPIKLFAPDMLEAKTSNLEKLWIVAKQASVFLDPIAAELKKRFSGFEEPTLLSQNAGRKSTKLSASEEKLLALIEDGTLSRKDVYVTSLRTPADMKKHIKDKDLAKTIFSTNIGAPILKKRKET